MINVQPGSRHGTNLFDMRIALEIVSFDFEKSTERWDGEINQISKQINFHLPSRREKWRRRRRNIKLIFNARKFVSLEPHDVVINTAKCSSSIRSIIVRGKFLHEISDHRPAGDKFENPLLGCFFVLTQVTPVAKHSVVWKLPKKTLSQS